MQVSWIDPDEIARLAAQLDGPLQREESASWDLDMLPDFSQLVTLEEPGAAASADLADAFDAPVPEPLDRKGAAPPPEIEQIREKLQAIRNRAQDAGLLPPGRLQHARQEATTVAELPEVASPKVPAPPSVAIGQPAVPVPEAPSVNFAPSTAPVSDPASVENFPQRAVVHLPPAPLPVPAMDSPVSPLPSPTPFLPLDGSLTERLKGFIPWAHSIAPCEDILLVDDHGDLLWGGSARADLALSVVLAAGAGLRTGSDALTRSSVFIRSRLGEKSEMSVLPCPTRHGMVTLALLNATCLPNETAACLREALTLCIEGKNPGHDSAASFQGESTS